MRKVRQGVMANRSDRDPPSLNVVEGREAHRANEARIGRFHQGQRAESPAPKAGYKTAICLPVTPKSVLAFREASIQNDMGGTLVRSVGLVRAKARIGLKNFAYNMRRLVPLERLAAAV